MPSTTPLDIHIDYVANSPAAQQKINAAYLDSDHNNIEQWANEDLLPALARVIRDDDSLIDGLVRIRNLANEVVTLLASTTAWQPKQAVVAASVGNLTLSGEQTVDGIALFDNDRVLVKDQTDASENGIYVVGTPWTRATDADAGSDLDYAYAFVAEGTINSGSGWVATSDSYAIDTSDITFAQVTGQYQTPIAVAQGGTGATNAAAARAGLGFQTIMDPVVLATSVADARIGLGGTTVGIAVFIAATAAAARAALGSLATGDALFTSSTAAAARAILGFQTAMNNVLLASATSDAREALGFPAALVDLWEAASQTDARQALGAGTTGEAVFQAASQTDARTAAGIVDDLSASATYDPASISAGAIGATQTITVTGAVLGDFTRASFSLDQGGIDIVSWVSATDTVSYFFRNSTAAPINLGSGTVRIRVSPQ